ncbi:M67 family metallopeptidase [Natranaerobius thermophilus]|uniref:Mov34/MPN/PAD-1 family protein n=1 Tax=Natranaerobius thermophilus (strain ATCC BAA-1301 / DSM 18059 / JW/NM-WN-LF) TaxID=457570 RepID=B2A154_NATTJ|nr:M67 family metallopeptidase [Natranaerobius thermophilus]ACB84677.1 Mov34/MPN/PAD-1 family protein [Natranaerobius thermophilus JW/NM-WN-LF]
MKIWILQTEYQKMLEHAKKEFPLECCGLMAGFKKPKGYVITNIYEMTNMEQSSTKYSLDPQEQFSVIKDIRNHGLELVGNYHSHPFTGCRLSDEDFRLAYDNDLVYAIISLKGELPVLKFFLIKENLKNASQELNVQLLVSKDQVINSNTTDEGGL